MATETKNQDMFNHNDYKTLRKLPKSLIYVNLIQNCLNLYEPNIDPMFLLSELAEFCSLCRHYFLKIYLGKLSKKHLALSEFLFVSLLPSYII